MHGPAEDKEREIGMLLQNVKNFKLAEEGLGLDIQGVDMGSTLGN